MPQAVDTNTRHEVFDYSTMLGIQLGKDRLSPYRVPLQNGIQVEQQVS
jgi:hypothetical protein